MEYKLEIKQIVEYPRSRMYRDFVQKLIGQKDIRVGHSCLLYHYVVLSSYANFRSSYEYYKGVRYTIHPGEWMCRVSELTEWFRAGTRRRTIAILDQLQERHLMACRAVGCILYLWPPCFGA